MVKKEAWVRSEASWVLVPHLGNPVGHHLLFYFPIREWNRNFLRFLLSSHHKTGVLGVVISRIIKIRQVSPDSMPKGETVSVIPLSHSLQGLLEMVWLLLSIL